MSMRLLLELRLNRLENAGQSGMRLRLFQDAVYDGSDAGNAAGVVLGVDERIDLSLDGRRGNHRKGRGSDQIAIEEGSLFIGNCGPHGKSSGRGREQQVEVHRFTK